MTVDNLNLVPTEAVGASPKVQCTITSATVYRLRKFKPETYCWADITIRSWMNGGAIDVQSDYGSYSYQWCSTGCDDIREFLVGLDYGYFMGKAHPSHGYVTDWDLTAKDVKRLILKDRRDGGLSAAEAREIMDAAEAIEWGEAVFYEMRDYPKLAQFYTDSDYPKRTVKQGQCNGFWNIVWPEITRIWREEIAARKATSTPEGAAK